MKVSGTHYRTIWLDDDGWSVAIIDQPRLPHEFEVARLATLEDTAWRIRTEVLERTGISVSLGGGTRRVIAKLAATKAKPAGVYVVAPGTEQDFLDPLPLAELPGVVVALA